MWKRYLVEIGYGADLHGMDGMEAAARAVRDAVSHCCMCGLVETLGVKEVYLTPHIMEDIPNTPIELTTAWITKKEMPTRIS